MKNFQSAARHVLYLALCVVLFCGCGKTDQQVKDYNIGKVGNLKQVLITCNFLRNPLKTSPNKKQLK